MKEELVPVSKVVQNLLAEEVNRKEEEIPFAPVEIEEDLAPLHPKIFREGGKAREKKCNFLFHSGGIGDYLCGIPALEYIADNHPHVLGEVYTIDTAVELFQHILKKYYPRWQVFDRRAAQPGRLENRPTYMPFLRPINATGAHLLDLGFMYYANMSPPPAEYNRYPRLDLSSIENVPLEGKYAVMTPGATISNRVMKARAFNGIKSHFLSKGITPIFLGKKTITDIRHINYEEDYDYTGGLDLREKTTLLQAAGIMSRAELVVGLDNGLLHLAACTDAPIVFGYNIASPEHRRPRRASGNIWDVYPDPKALPCTFCQSNMRFLFDHDFAKCVYKDNKCLEILSDPELWIGKIDEALESR